MNKSLIKILNVCIILSMMMLFNINTIFAADYDNVRTFTFTDTGITDNGVGDSNYSYSGTDLKITGEGTYLITGNCSNGSVTVKKKSENVNLIFRNLNISNNTTAPVTFAKNTQVNVTIDGYATFEDNVLNSEKYLVAKGYATYNSTDDTYYCTDSGASVLGLNSGDEVEAENATFKTKGNSKVTISGSGTLNVTTHSKNAIKAGSTLDDNENDTTGNSSSAYLIMDGITANLDAFDAYQASNDDTYGDGINAASYLLIKSGTYNVSAGDDGIHCDFVLDIGSETTSPDINILKSYEGLEGSIVNIYNGDIDINSQDDAINAANGDILDSSNTNIYNKNYQFAINVYDGDIRAISGANTTTVNDGDAFDSNGNILINGGKVVAFGGSNGNSFDTGQDDNHDVDDSFVINGGTVLGVGTSAMAITPTTNSQNWVSWGISDQNSGGQPGQPGQPDQPGQPPTNQNPPVARAQANSSATNMSNIDNIKLAVENNKYSVGSNVIISKNNSLSVLNGSDTLISDTAQNSATSVLFSGNIESSTTNTDTNNTDNSSNNTDNNNSDNNNNNTDTNNNNNSDNTNTDTNTNNNNTNTDNNSTEDTTQSSDQNTTDTISDNSDSSDDEIIDEEDEDIDEDNGVLDEDEEESTTTSKTVKTGDESNIYIYMILLIFALFSSIGLFIYNIKTKE